MAVTYIKRYRMEARIDQLALNAVPILPDGFELIPWAPQLLTQHAEVKWESFRDEIDVHVFACLGERDGCRRLMRELSERKDFVPEATWLACRTKEISGQPLLPGKFQAVGTVQGLMASSRDGAIQNLGVHPQFRDLGLGEAMLRAALRGFASVGCRYVHLEVTVQNSAAIRLYERVGFRRVETLFKISEVLFA
jgi:ribosomal protein S18 acetylase RimI-like enzyme